MYKFTEKYRDAKISIPSSRLVIDSSNVNQYSELIVKLFKNHKEIIEFVEEEKSVKKVAPHKEDKPVSSPPSKLEG